MFHHLDFNIVSKALVETDPLMCHFTLGACDVVVWRRRPYFFIPSQHDSGVLHFAPCLARVFWSNQIPHCCWTELLAERVCLTFTRKSLHSGRKIWPVWRNLCSGLHWSAQYPLCCLDGDKMPDIIEREIKDNCPLRSSQYLNSECVRV